MKGPLPTIICSSVIRSSQQGESHGGIYLVDLNNEKFRQVIDWDDQQIDWQGRGADRGLRGIAFYNGTIVAAASDEVFLYDTDFNVIKSFRNRYLKHCHEIFVTNDTLYLTSTGFDSILLFDLKKEKFINGMCFRKQNDDNGLTLIHKILDKITGERFEFSFFDPNNMEGPSPLDSTHINNVFVIGKEIYFSGTKMSSLMKINEAGEVLRHQEIPKGTHNVQPFKGGFLMNNTMNDDILYQGRDETKHFKIRKYATSELLNTNLPNDHARQGFGRGLCGLGDYFISGSSPATVSLYHFDNPDPIKSVCLTKDVRNAIHGLEIFPHNNSAI